jgi:hypothetical protein
MRRGRKTSNRSIVRKLGLFVCAASVVGTLAGVARSQSADPEFFCLFNVTNFCLSNVTATSGNVGCCVQGDAACLKACVSSCRTSKSTSNSQCVQNCVGEFLILQSDCIGRLTNTTIP